MIISQFSFRKEWEGKLLDYQLLTLLKIFRNKLLITFRRKAYQIEIKALYLHRAKETRLNTLNT